jgi:ABC-type branched-subunit amino acid transport system permease subunit
MSTARRPAERWRVPSWIRAAAAVVVAAGAYCLTYHLVFYSLWRFLFGEEVWPWPQWSLWLLIILPGVVALTAAVFMLLAKLTTRNTWIAVAMMILALVGLVQYAAEVWKVMFRLGFRP